MTREIKMEIRMYHENEMRLSTTGYDRTTRGLNNSTNQGMTHSSFIPYAVHKSEICAFVFFCVVRFDLI